MKLPESAPIRTGLVGFGLGGSVFHAPLLLAEPRLHLAAVATSRHEQLAAAVPGAESVTTDELLAREDLDLIVISSPSGTHFDIAHAALSRGRHVVVDKPFAVHTHEANTLIELAEKQGVVLSVFQNRRWDNDFLTVRQLVESGELGTIYSFESHFDRYRPQIKPGWRELEEPGSGTLYDLGAHLIDQAIVLFGMPDAVTADIGTQRREAKAVDFFHIVLRYGRMRAILHNSTVVRMPGPRFAVHGDRGSFLKHGLDSQEDALKAGLRPGMPGWGHDAPEHHGTLMDAEGRKRSVPTLHGAYENYYAGIAGAILNGEPPPVHPGDSRDGLRIIEAALRSSREGRTVAA